MKENYYIGLDVHKKTIASAHALGGGRDLKEIEHGERVEVLVGGGDGPRSEGGVVREQRRVLRAGRQRQQSGEDEEGEARHGGVESGGT